MQIYMFSSSCFFLHYKNCICGMIFFPGLFFRKSPEKVLSDISPFLTKISYNRNTCGKHLLSLKACFLSGNEIHTQNPLVQKSKVHLIYAGIYLHEVHIHRLKTLHKHSILTCPIELPASLLLIHDTWEWDIFTSAASVIINLDCCFLPYLLVFFLLSSEVNNPSITVVLMTARASASRPHCQPDILYVE